MADLQGKVVAFLEGRRAAELADLIQRHHGTPLAAPCLREVHSPESPVLQASIATVLDARPDVVIFLTGVGTSTIFDAARSMQREADLRQALDEATVVVRGPKPTAALRKLGIRVDVTAPEPHTTAEVLGVLGATDLRGKIVAVQLYGEPNPQLSQSLAARGATVLELAPYAWDRPVDPAPILGLLDALDRRGVDVLLVTSQAQVENLFAIADESARLVRLDDLAIAAQGPVVEAALERRGLHASIRPTHAHMGALVLATAEYLSNSAPALQGALN
jgi:uroporphyrinogen-III synthase